MQFGIVQLERFSATDGSYSLVTNRELDDSQITATDAETTLLRSYFLRRNETIHVGNVQSSHGTAAKEFKLFPTGEPVKLNLVYPKPEKSELRLYISKRAGFFPNQGDVWFLFVKREDDSLWIGSMPEKDWRRLNSIGKADDAEQLPEETIDDIDAQILAQQNEDSKTVPEERVAVETESKREVIVRRREIAVIRMQQSRYKCEYDASHSLFIAKATGCPYLEAHHIIPICFQKQLHGLKLDSLNNLCCLCPSCHRAIHHAEDDLVKSILNRVAEKRDITRNFGLSAEDLYRLYAVEDIVRQ